MRKDYSHLILADIKQAQITSMDLRNTLWLELEALREGRSSVQKANAVSKLAAQILDSVRIEVQAKWTYLMQNQSKSSPNALIVTEKSGRNT